MLLMMRYYVIHRCSLFHCSSTGPAGALVLLSLQVIIVGGVAVIIVTLVVIVADTGRCYESAIIVQCSSSTDGSLV